MATSEPGPQLADAFLVALGASADGLDALERFFAHVPERTGMTFVVIQHLSPDHESLTDRILARHTAMPVHVAAHGQRLAPDTVYLNPARRMMGVRDGCLQLADPPPSPPGSHLIDHFFRSMAHAAPGRCAAIVLSGAGSDGALGIREVHGAGGLVIVQTPAGLRFDGMPLAAIDTGHVDLMLAAEDMPAALQAFRPDTALEPHPESATGGGLGQLIDLLSESYGISFFECKLPTIARRTERRMKAVGAADLAAYLARLADDPIELDTLYHDLLVGVTTFFRDRDAFDEIARLLPDALQALAPGDEFRVWVVACASGEEAYSVAILVREALDGLALRNPVKIFATDVHRKALRIASTGVYDEAALAEVGAERQRRWFFATGAGTYQISPAIRSMVVFGPHDVFHDVPFNRLDLITCRNLLVYLRSPAQRRVLERFRYALKPGGLLFLGATESLSDLGAQFQIVDARRKIVRKEPTGTPLIGTYDALLEAVVPPSLLVDAHHHLVQAFAGASKYLRVRDGLVTWNAIDLLGDDLRIAVTGGLERVFTEHAPLRYRDLRVEPGGHAERVDVTIREIVNPRTGEPHALITFDAAHVVGANPAPAPGIPGDEQARDKVAALEHALRVSKENLRVTAEALETSNQELQEANEELLASNEELKTTNEQIDTVNHELMAVKPELQHKLDELTQLTADMDLLIASTEVHTLFLDSDLRIRRFMPLIGEVFHLVASDVGRRVEWFNHALRDAAIYVEAERVLATGIAFEQQVQSADETWYLLRILPYRRGERTEGIVLTLVDITSLKRAEAEARQATARRDHFLAMLSHELRNPLAAILNAARVLERSALPPGDAPRWHRLLLERAQHMTRLVDDLLDIARLTQNKLVLRRAQLDLAATVRGVLDEVDPELRARGLTLRTQVEDDLIVFGDATRLHQLQVNLLTNAARHAPAGSEVSYTVREVGDSAEICVADTGTGIAPEMLDSIFELFVQGDQPAMHRDDGGLGVGLALVRRIAELHGGTASATSPGVGRGAEFRVRVPLVAPTAVARPPAVAQEPGRPRTVLLVDDDHSSRAALAKLLELDGIAAATASNGSAALALLSAGPAPDLVLLDLGLPGMNGLEVCRRIRALPAGDAQIVLALTGFGQDSDGEATRQAGFDGHLTKPIDVGDIYATYAQCRTNPPRHPA